MLKTFIIIPFAKKFNDIYTIIKDTCISVSIDPVRADEIKEPGPIINQIYSSIEEASFIIAEVSDKNPNVYYEVGVAHALSKPIVLLAQSHTIKHLPFDIQHQRVLSYKFQELNEFKENLTFHLTFLKELLTNKNKSLNSNSLVTNLSSGKDNPKFILKQIIDQIGKEFNLINPVLFEQKYIFNEGIILTLIDDFNEKVTILLDINGIIKRKKRI